MRLDEQARTDGTALSSTARMLDLCLGQPPRRRGRRSAHPKWPRRDSGRCGSRRRMPRSPRCRRTIGSQAIPKRTWTTISASSRMLGTATRRAGTTRPWKPSVVAPADSPWAGGDWSDVPGVGPGDVSATPAGNVEPATGEPPPAEPPGGTPPGEAGDAAPEGAVGGAVLVGTEGLSDGLAEAFTDGTTDGVTEAATEGTTDDTGEGVSVGGIEREGRIERLGRTDRLGRIETPGSTGGSIGPAAFAAAPPAISTTALTAIPLRMGRPRRAR